MRGVGWQQAHLLKVVVFIKDGGDGYVLTYAVDSEVELSCFVYFKSKCQQVFLDPAGFAAPRNSYVFGLKAEPTLYKPDGCQVQPVIIVEGELEISESQDHWLADRNVFRFSESCNDLILGHIEFGTDDSPGVYSPLDVHDYSRISKLVVVLDLYSAVDLAPWPNDVPSRGMFLGSFELEEFEAMRAAAAPCFETFGIDLGFFVDWFVPAETNRELSACLSGVAASATPEAHRPLLKLLEMFGRAEGGCLLAVCD